MREEKKFAVDFGGGAGATAAIAQLIEDGYKIDHNKSYRFASNNYVIVAYKDEDGSDKPEKSDSEIMLESLEGLTKKSQLLSFASKNEINVPESIAIPSAIKKYLKSYINGDLDVKDQEQAPEVASESTEEPTEEASE